MTLRQQLSSSPRWFLFILICLCVQPLWRCVYYIVNWGKIPSLPGEMKSTELFLMHEDVRSHCCTLLREMAALTKCHSLSTLSSVPISLSLSWSPRTSVFLIAVNSWMPLRLKCHFTITAKPKRTHCAEITLYLALYLPRFGYGRQVTSSHHHGPWNITHDWDMHVVCWCLPLHVCVSVIHDNLFACGLQHHVLGPVVPVLVGLGLVHDLLEHCPFPAWKQSRAPVLISFFTEIIRRYSSVWVNTWFLIRSPQCPVLFLKMDTY